eukprot:m.899125 g.899125  ORF g.899125 m.899125 type:complete len:60 (-) comp23678_c0_seq2:4454-4633(-)
MAQTQATEALWNLLLTQVTLRLLAMEFSRTVSTVFGVQNTSVEECCAVVFREPYPEAEF